MTDIDTSESVLTRREGPWLHVTFNRPDNRNAMSPELVAGVRAAFASVADDRTCRAIVLRGNGNTFSAGGDIRGFKSGQGEATDSGEGGRDPMWLRNRQGGDFFTEIDQAPQAVIAVVDGAAMGGGFGLVCCADIVVATERARMGLTETTLGILPAQILPFVIARIGKAKTRRLTVTAERIKTDAAAELGLVDYPVADLDAAEVVVAQELEKIRRSAPLALKHAKEVIQAVGTMSLSDTLDFAADKFTASMRSGEGTEGVKAFLEKRPPVWAETDGN